MLAMPPLNYSKWDQIEDSDDEPDLPPPENKPMPPPPGTRSDEKATATVRAGFVVKAVSLNDQRNVYINVCSSEAVPGTGMSATPNAVNRLGVTFPYIVGDLRSDFDGEDPCWVIECLFHPDTLRRANREKLTMESLIKTAVALVSQNAVALTSESEWELFNSDLLVDAPTADDVKTWFFAPGRLDMRAIE